MRTPISALTLGFLAATVAFSQDVKTDFDKTMSWERYKTFAWREGSRPPNGVVDNSLVSARIQKAVDAELAKRGWNNSGPPDVFLTYRIAAKNEREVINTGGPWGPYYGRRWGGGWGGGGRTYVNHYVAGSLIVDMIDARSGKLIWRSYATDNASRLPDLVTEKKIDKIVEKSFKNFPKQAA